MTRKGWRQRSAEPVKPFTIHVVEGPPIEEPATGKRGKGRPTDPRIRYKDKQVATFVHIVERLLPVLKKKDVLAALSKVYGSARSTVLGLLAKSENLEEASEVTVDVRGPAHGWLWSFLSQLGSTRPHPREGRIRELIQQRDKLDPRQLDFDHRHDPEKGPPADL